jgi:hypothetical protein
VIRRDQGMNLGVVLADAFAGQLDRRWDSKCFASKVHRIEALSCSSSLLQQLLLELLEQQLLLVATRRASHR